MDAVSSHAVLVPAPTARHHVARKDDGDEQAGDADEGVRGVALRVSRERQGARRSGDAEEHPGDRENPLAAKRRHRDGAIDEMGGVQRGGRGCQGGHVRVPHILDLPAAKRNYGLSVSIPIEAATAVWRASALTNLTSGVAIRAMKS